jgi:hypothetical protein
MQLRSDGEAALRPPEFLSRDTHEVNAGGRDRHYGHGHHLPAKLSNRNLESILVAWGNH